MIKEDKKNKEKGKRGQVTLFVIIAIVIIAAISLIFYLRAAPRAIPKEAKVIEDYFISCLEEQAEDGARILGEHAGYIELPEFEPGSAYMPFSSQLDFLGSAIPYWFYISGNNIVKEQIPSLQDMEKQLAEFISENIDECSFVSFEKQGYEIEKGEKAKTNVRIRDNSISIEVDYDLIIQKGEMKSRITKHSLSLRSKIGKFYKFAKKIYDAEQKKLFFEDYAIDVLTLYAPTTHVELGCAPKIFIKQEIEQNVKKALEGNVQAIKLKGNYYRLAKPEHKYFVVDVGEDINEDINFLYSREWPTRFSLWSSSAEKIEEGKDVVIAKPIGTQAGLGILGFCFVQYHFIYDLAYPVLVQIYDEKEIFQFPLVVLVDKNKAREAAVAEALPSAEAELCKHKLTPVKVYVYDTNLEPVEAEIKYKCFNTVCEIGKASLYNGEAYLQEKFPQCVNGFILASADGFADAKIQFSTNIPGIADIIMQPLYKLDVELVVGGVPISSKEQALVTFSSADYTTTIAYPQQKKVELTEGFYDITASVYREGDMTLAGTKTTQCVKVPATGIAGFFGIEREKCFDIDIPAQTLTQILSGGGSAEKYFSAAELEESKKIVIATSFFPIPKNLIELQDAYELVDTSGIDLWLE